MNAEGQALTEWSISLLFAIGIVSGAAQLTYSSALKGYCTWFVFEETHTQLYPSRFPILRQSRRSFREIVFNTPRLEIQESEQMIKGTAYCDDIQESIAFYKLEAIQWN